TDVDERDCAGLELAAMRNKVAPRYRTIAEAMCLAGLRRMEEATVQFRKALEESPEDLFTIFKCAEFALRLDRPAEAEPLLRKLLAHAGAASGITPWARRELAWVLAGKGSESARREALALLEQNHGELG